MEAPTRLLRSSADALTVLQADVERQAHILACAASDLASIKTTVDKHDTIFAEQVVLNVRDQCYHRSPSLATSCDKAQTWHSFCGWKFGTKPGNFQILAALPGPESEVRRCFKCFGR